MLEQNLLTFLQTESGFASTFYSHIDRHPGNECVWFSRNGDQDDDDLDGAVGDEYPIVYFDVEVYAQTAIAAQAVAHRLRRKRGFRGLLDATDSNSYVEDLMFDTQAADYTQQASYEDLPPHGVSFRLSVTGYGQPA